jgi:protein O-mannosyl-transferase
VQVAALESQKTGKSLPSTEIKRREETIVAHAAPSGHQATTAASARNGLIFSLILVAATLISYNPVTRNGFIDFDDGAYILSNQQVQQGLTRSTIKWSFTTFREGNWHPLTWLSHALDCELFHLNPVGHHYTNLLLHAANALLLFLLLKRATGAMWPSWLVAALFALHPVNVESVAWVAERKNVLSMFFFLLTLLAYDRFARTERRWLYISVIVLFGLGLLAKPQIVTLPFVLLLWDYWPLDRISMSRREQANAGLTVAPLRALVWEKWPLFGLAAADCVMTVLAQHSGHTMRTLAQVSLTTRIENVFVSYVRYLGKAFWPAHLIPLYPHPGNSLPPWQVAASVVLLLAISAFVWGNRDRRYLAMGWLWFLGTLIPMIGIVTVGDQAMADRYAYLPFIGVFIAVVWATCDLALHYRVPRKWLAVPAALILCALGFLTHRQIGYWSDDETLWRYTLTVSDNNFVAHNNLALALTKVGRADDAIAHFRIANRQHQYPADQILKLGLYELRMGHPEEAVEDGRVALAAATDAALRAAALRVIGRALIELRRFDEADETYHEALRLNSDDADSLVDLGLLALHSGDMGQAIDNFSRASKLDPRDVNFLLLAQAQLYAGQLAEAERTVAEAQKVSTNFADSQQAVAGFLGMAGVPYLASPSSAPLH